MKINQLVDHVNRLTDEDFSLDMIVPFLNDAIAQINTECRAEFPFLDATDNESEPVIPESWQRRLLCTFAAGRVKENDSSQFEYVDFYNQFDQGIVDFKLTYKIPNEYKTYTADHTTVNPFSSSPWRWN